mgnify:CR=1 FL=1
MQGVKKGTAGYSFRVLTIVARPLDVEDLPLTGEAWMLMKGLQTVEVPVEIRFVTPRTKNRVRELLQDPQGWEVVHFDGHGSENALAAETEDCLADPVPAEKLAEMLRSAARTPKLVVLSACASAEIAKGLTGAVPAVIGMREPVSMELTTRFVSALYAALGGGRTIRNAFQIACDAVKGMPNLLSDTPSQELPALFGRALDRPVCQPGPKGRPIVKGDKLYGIPAPSESGFYGVFADGESPRGRKGLLHRLVKMVREGKRLVSITGVGGIGKSTLAAALARRIAWRFPGGVFWVDGRGYPELRLEAVLEPFFWVFGHDFLKLPPSLKRQMALDYLRRLDAASLIVVDNADAAEEEALRFLREVPEPSAVVLTVRERPEWGGCVVPVGRMEPEEGLVFLLREIGRRKNRPDWAPGSDAEMLLEMAEKLDGHPLALLQAAALVEDMGAAGALELVRRNPVRGELEQRFDFSYEPLPAAEKELLHRLAAIPADFDRDAVKGMWTRQASLKEALGLALSLMLRRPREDCLELLRELVRRSWVERWEPVGGYDRYRMHPLVREYVHRKAGEAMVEHDRRMAAYFLALADWLGDQLNTDQALTAIRMAEVERRNLLGGQEAAAALGMWDWAIDYGYRLDDLFERTGHWDDRRRALELGLKAAKEKGDRREVAGLAHNLAVALQDQGDYGEAERLYRESLKIAEQLGDKAGVAQTLHQLGMLAQDRGDYGEAERLYRESLEIKKQLGDKAGVAQTLHQLGMLAQDRGDYGEAERLYRESLKIAEQLGDKAGVAQTLHQLGMLAQARGDYGEAERLYRESLKIAEQLGNKAGVAQTLHNLGALAQDRGDYGEAERLYRESLKIAEQLGDKAGVAQTLHQLGMLAQDRGDYGEAERLYRESLEIAEQLGDKAGVAKTLHQLGTLAQDRGDYGEAERLYRESLKIAEQLGDKAGVALTTSGLGNLAYDRGDYSKAKAEWEKALVIFQELGDRKNKAGILHQLGILAQARGDYAEAERLYRESLKIAEQLGDKAGVAQTLHQLGMLAQDRGDYGEAERLYRESLGIEKQLGNKAGVAITMAQLAQLEEARGNVGKALELICQAERIFVELGHAYAGQVRQHRERLEKELGTRRGKRDGAPKR